MMTQHASLGDKLREIQLAVAQAAQAKALAHNQMVYERVQRERNQIRTFWYDYVAHVNNQIVNGKLPKARKVPAVFEQRMNASSYLITHELHSHHDMWLEIQSGAAKLGLVVILTYNHDGYGETSWYEISVEPLT